MTKQVLNEPVDVIENKIHKLSPELLSILLKDNSTGENLYWATSTYEKYGDLYTQDKQMLPELMIGLNLSLLTPRVSKTQEEQQARTKDKGEVFTPAWMCNKQINYIDEDWFGRVDVFNTEIEYGWKVNKNKISFPKELGKNWEQYVTNLRIEITCGEAPYLVSRYDVVKGEIIPVENRIGILDRKLRVINENVDDEKEWVSWAIKAYQSTYGYDYQGDNVLIARENLLYTLIDNMIYKFGHQPNLTILKKLAKVISWNIWQMDGLNYTVPYSSIIKEDLQICLFDFGDEKKKREPVEALIKNWRTGKNIKFKDLKGSKKGMKFDYCVGNPPYQESAENTSDKPVYDRFMDAAYEIADVAVLITPARFLFNAGKTPKEWNRKMLNDTHFKVMYYNPHADEIFPTTGFKGGVAITLRDKYREFGAIKVYTKYPELNSIIEKVTKTHDNFRSLSDFVYAPESYRFTDSLHNAYPDAHTLMSKDHNYDLTSNIFDKFIETDIFTDEPKDEDSIAIFGLENKKRKYKYINSSYVKKHDNLDNYKLFVPKSFGTGEFGDVMASTVIGKPGIGHTQTFISIGRFSTLAEAENLDKYLRTKFVRAMLGILKITQDNKKSVWAYVPVEDFTQNSDIDWSKSLKEIDRELYSKYTLSDEEIEFIESHVKEMK